mmetsp:Transcript_8344/g.23175  ORF Transcript_8344/g.23175 Transcript_8344/m.23175 type:complete len:182 (+) Transcript_8344:616-1161(+)
MILHSSIGLWVRASGSGRASTSWATLLRRAQAPCTWTRTPCAPGRGCSTSPAGWPSSTSSSLYMLWPIVAWDMLAAAVFGLTPLSPYGLVGTLLAYIFGPAEPHWKPAEPKRFAWVVGFFLVNCCALGGLLQSRPLMIVAVMMCNAATWAESALGFCVGCWMWNTVIAPHIGKQACQECKL